MRGAADSSNSRRWFFRAQVWIGLILGVVVIVLVAAGVDLAELRNALRSVRVPWVVLALLASLLTPVLKAVRWRWLFCPYRPASSALSLAGLVVIGQATNFLIPGRWGELVRAYLGGEETGISKWFVLGTLAAEKLLDLVILALLVIALLPFVALPESMAGRVEWVLLAALVVTVGAAVLLGARGFWLGLAGRILALLPPVAASRWYARIEATLNGLAALGDRRTAATIWGWTLLFWAVAGLTNLLLLLAFGQPPSIVAALLLLAVLQGGIAVPSTPGKIGVFQLLSMGALAIVGVPQAIGLAYGVVLHVLVVGSITVWAAIALWRRSWNLGRLAKASASWQLETSEEVER